MIKEISATHLHEKMKSESCNIIDVREKVEFATGMFRQLLTFL